MIFSGLCWCVCVCVWTLLLTDMSITLSCCTCPGGATHTSIIRVVGSLSLVTSCYYSLRGFNQPEWFKTPVCGCLPISLTKQTGLHGRHVMLETHNVWIVAAFHWGEVLLLNWALVTVARLCRYLIGMTCTCVSPLPSWTPTATPLEPNAELWFNLSLAAMIIR